MVHLKIDEQILVDKHRDPQGNIVALTSLEVWRILEPRLNIHELEEIDVEISGNKVFLKSKSRAKIKAIVDKAKSLGITVLGSL